MCFAILTSQTLKRMGFVQIGSYVRSIRLLLASNRHLLAFARLVRLVQVLQLERFALQMLAWLCGLVVSSRAFLVCSTLEFELNRPVDPQFKRVHANLCKLVVHFQILLFAARSNQRTHIQLDVGKCEHLLSTTLLWVAFRAVQTLFACAYELHDMVHSASAHFPIQIFGQLGQIGTHCSTNEICTERIAKASRQVQRVHFGVFRCRLAFNQHLEHVKSLRLLSLSDFPFHFFFLTTNKAEKAQWMFDILHKRSQLVQSRSVIKKKYKKFTLFKIIFGYWSF